MPQSAILPTVSFLGDRVEGALPMGTGQASHGEWPMQAAGHRLTFPLMLRGMSALFNDAGRPTSVDMLVQIPNQGS